MPKHDEYAIDPVGLGYVAGLVPVSVAADVTGRSVADLIATAESVCGPWARQDADGEWLLHQDVVDGMVAQQAP